MPHCLIEYSSSVAEQASDEQLLDCVFQALANSPLFDASAVRVSSQRYEHCRMGEASGFVHVTIRLFDGRSHNDKAQLTRQVGQALVGLGMTDIKIFCECVDIHSPTCFHST
ncbi:MAG: 5-carboxymethyl-2-hydroxymuconate isomerase [Gammaproteobacteria bacterium]|nr:MAG: 5-carboxymethyl-2-hydroxymuconate isomerase [Gammaproteobacteria bacterium]